MTTLELFFFQRFDTTKEKAKKSDEPDKDRIRRSSLSQEATPGVELVNLHPESTIASRVGKEQRSTLGHLEKTPRRARSSDVTGWTPDDVVLRKIFLPLLYLVLSDRVGVAVGRFLSVLPLSIGLSAPGLHSLMGPSQRPRPQTPQAGCGARVGGLDLRLQSAVEPEAKSLVGGSRLGEDPVKQGFLLLSKLV
ncbi:unnamed protein product [Caenorhabditis auriculariae]|uniref:Uncharacterized protein n=1 Tax=Caenorhabditis auriculariae TaxID=2777116 RepID=A0A8S1HE47_9PELO|nr:unnamed protein product [Caenorhabditis auriculariae]